MDKYNCDKSCLFFVDSSVSLWECTNSRGGTNREKSDTLFFDGEEKRGYAEDCYVPKRLKLDSILGLLKERGGKL